MDEFESFVKKFTDHPFLGVKPIGKHYFLANDDIWQMREEQLKNPFAAGIYLGSVEKNQFIPSPAAIDRISKMNGSDRRKIIVNHKAEWLFLCGRSVLSDSIAKNPFNISEGLVLVQNTKDENLGLGKFKQEGKDLVIRNIIDKGHYLRGEVKKKHSREE